VEKSVGHKRTKIQETFQPEKSVETCVMLAGSTTAGPVFKEEWRQCRLRASGELRRDFHRQSVDREFGGVIQLVRRVPGVTHEELVEEAKNRGIEVTVLLNELHNFNCPSATLTDRPTH
jgi:hypothetical protein